MAHRRHALRGAARHVSPLAEDPAQAIMINPKVTWGVWCVLVLCVSGQDATPTSGDRLEAETAARPPEPNTKPKFTLGGIP